MKKGTVCIFVCLCALMLTTPVVAQQHARFRVLEILTSPAGLSARGGPPIIALYAPYPQYTREARNADVRGALVIEAILGTDGCLRKVRPIRRLGYGLDESAVEAVQRWKFKPFLKNGVPTETMVRGVLQFDPAWSPERSLSNERLCREH